MDIISMIMSQNKGSAFNSMMDTNYVTELEWDGDFTGRDICYINDKHSAGYVHISDLQPKKEQLIGSTLFARNDGTDLSDEVDDSDIFIEKDGRIRVGLVLNVVTKETEDYPKTGVWVCFGKILGHEILFQKIQFGKPVPYYTVKQSYLPGIPFFDLAEMGLPTVIPNGTVTMLQTNAKSVLDALSKGPVKFRIMVNVGVETDLTFIGTMAYPTLLNAQVHFMAILGGVPYFAAMDVFEDRLGLACAPLAQ